MTAIEKAVAELKRLQLCLPDRDRRPTVRAVFESIDVEALDTVIQKNWISTPGEFRNALLAYLLEGTDQ